jgi:hypothetical protein
MPTFATYDVVSDAPTLLPTPANPIHDFTLGFASTVDFGIRSVLSYMVDPGSASGVTFKMSVSNILSNGSEEFKLIIPETTLPSQHSFVRQEVIDAGTFARLNTGVGIHKLRIHVTAGAANFSDIVHMYQASF